MSIGDFFAFLVKLLISKLQQPPAPSAPVEPTAPVAAPTAPVATKPSMPVVAPPSSLPPPLKVVPNNQATGVQLVLSQTMNDGPMPGTGGVIHQLSAADAASVVALILANCKKYPKLPIALMFAWIRAESDFDPEAIDPNEENWSAHPTDEEKLQNQDLGLAQFSWATLLGMPDFAGMTSAEIMTQALDAEWSCGAMFAFCDDLRQQAEAAVLAEPTLLARIPDRDVAYLFVQAYNSGFAGAVDLARTSGASGNWDYARGVIADYEKWKALFV